MYKLITKIAIATIKDLIVAFFLASIITALTAAVFGQKIQDVVSLVNLVSFNNETKAEKETILNNGNRLQNYPEYGSKYAAIKIDKIGVNLDVYFGDTLEILKKGIGHSSGSYFPGESGSIIYMGHRSAQVLKRLGELQKGDEIQVTATYGQFNYKVTDTKVVDETDIAALPVQHEKEILMLYTCYPFDYIGHAKQRYVVYSELEVRSLIERTVE